MEFKREKYINELTKYKNNGLIKIISGARRVGKSYLLNTLFFRLLVSSGVNEEHIIRFAFDNDENIDRLDEYYPNEETRIKDKKRYYVNSKKFRKYISNQIKDDGKYYLLLDEIQSLENFVGTLNGYLYKNNIDVYVTGSNSYLLSKDIITEFRGRSVTIQVYPLTFKEYFLTYKNKTIEEAWKDYHFFGGMPIVVNFKDDDSKEKYLKDLCEESYLKDVIQHNSIRRQLELKEVFDIIASSIGSLTNPNKLSKTFKSITNKTLSRDIIFKYINYFEDAYLISIAKRFNIKGKKYINAPYKIYFNDIGVRNARLNFKQIEITHLIENIIYNELLYRGYSVDVGQINVNEKANKKDKNNHAVFALNGLEIDFIASKGNDKYYVQSAYDISDANKYNKELKPLINLSDGYRRILITMNGSKPYKNEYGILIIDLFDFLLNDDSLNY